MQAFGMMSEPSLASGDADLESDYARSAEAFQPWIDRDEQSAEEQRRFQDVLRRRAGAEFGRDSYVSSMAQVFTQRFSIGDRSWVAAGAIIRGHVAIGANSSVNPYAHIAGKVTIGDGVRIAGLASIYGFNHGFSRTDMPIYQQPHTCKGIVIGDGTWVGANAVVIDGVAIGAHCIVAAGAVVTRNVPDYAIIAGNPGRVIGNRKDKPAEDRHEAKSREGTVRALLYAENPYQGLPFTYPKDLQGWDSKHSIFAEVIAETRPRLIVEVGTWKGASAIHMAEICSELGLQTEIVCVDTWLGNWQHWSRGNGGPGSREDLKIVNGFPRLYYQFMSNVLHAGVDGIITPLPLTGVAGAKLFEHFGITPDVVYIDGDHEYESVLFDVRLWLKQLGKGGVLIGDDYNWPTVKRAVDEVVRAESLEIRVVGQKFTLRRCH